MKYIFDFDDVILDTSKKLKPYMFGVLEHQFGIAQEESMAVYNQKREKEFSLRDFFREILAKKQVSQEQIDELYSRVISACKSWVNVEMVYLIEILGKENCYLVTNGSTEFQKDKLVATDVLKYFKDYKIVKDSKKEEVARICREHQTEKVIFVDDKEKYLNDISESELPNLVKFHYKEGHGITALKSEIQKAKNPEIVEIRRRS